MSQYLDLAKEGLVPMMDCPLDQGLLFANIDGEDQIFLYCLSCDYKKYIGLQMYEMMGRLINGKK